MLTVATVLKRLSVWAAANEYPPPPHRPSLFDEKPPYQPGFPGAPPPLPYRTGSPQVINDETVPAEPASVRHLMLDGRNAFCKAAMGEHDRATHILANVTCGTCRQEFTSRVPQPRRIEQLERDDDAELRIAFDGSLRLGILRMDLEQAVQLMHDLHDNPSVKAALADTPVAHTFARLEARKDLAARLRAAAVLLEIE